MHMARCMVWVDAVDQNACSEVRQLLDARNDERL